MSIEQVGEKRRFPSKFLWGSGTSAYQVEGNQTGERRTDLDVHVAKLPASPILPGEIGPDWWTVGNAEADFERMASLGLKAQRFGIEWARIYSEPREISREAVNRYLQMVKYLRQLGITPLVTLNHFTLPYWFAELGGWENHSNLKYFQEYAKVLANEFGSDVPYWITINEPTISVTLSHLSGIWPPGKQNPKAALQVYHNLVGAHNVASEEIKRILPDAQVGNANAIIWLKPKNPHSPVDKLITRFYNYLFNLDYLKKTAQQLDFVGVNFYSGYHLKFQPGLNINVRPPGLIEQLPFAQFFKPEGIESDLEYPIVPDFFLDALHHLYQRFQKPVIITENGIADREDKYRSLYILTHLVALWEAIQKGVDVRGYIHWSTVDNLEFLEGFKPRFGLLGMDPRRSDRTIRQSANLYGEIAGSNAIDVQSLADRYLTEEQKIKAQKIITELQR